MKFLILLIFILIFGCENKSSEEIQSSPDNSRDSSSLTMDIWDYDGIYSLDFDKIDTTKISEHINILQNVRLRIDSSSHKIIYGAGKISEFELLSNFDSTNIAIFETATYKIYLKKFESHFGFVDSSGVSTGEYFSIHNSGVHQ